MAYVFFILSALAVIQQKTVESSEDNSFNLTRTSWSLPDFSNSNRGKNALLVEAEPWIPSRTTQLTFLTPRQPLKVELELNRDAKESVIESCDLLFKCNAGDTTVKTLNLISNDTNHQWKVSNPFCTSELGFEVERHNATSYSIKILTESKVPFNQSLEHYMEFSISIRYKQGTLTSATLYAFSLVSLFNINSEDATIPLAGITKSSPPFRRYFLTSEAIAFLVDRNFASEKLNRSVVEIDFLERGLLDVVKRAPNIIRQLLTVTVTLKVTQKISKLNESRQFLISNGEESIQQASSSGHNDSNDVRHGLSLVTGKLLIDRFFLVKISQWRVDVALRVSINGLRNGSEIEKAVISYDDASQGPRLPAMPAAAQLECRSLVETKDPTTTIIPFYNGMRDIGLTATGVCPCPQVKNSQRDCKLDYSVQFVREPSEDEKHQSTVGSKGIRSFQDNKRTVTLEGLRSLADMGKYIFVVRDTNSHRYHLVDANLPTFEALPDVINVNKYGALELECRLHRTGENYKSIHMSSHFELLNYQTGDKWREFTLDEFATKWLRVPPNKVRKIKESAGEFHGYRLIFPAVDYRWGRWRLSYVCRAEIVVSELKSALGIPRYQFEVRAPVRYHGFGELVIRNSRGSARSLVCQTSIIIAACFVVASVAAVRWNVLYY